MTEAFFTKDADSSVRFYPTEHCRGPWSEVHCHAGPPTGLLARAMEQVLPEQRLTRITVELTRPIPHEGFDVNADIVRQGRTVSTATASITDLSGKPVITASGLFMSESESPLALPAMAEHAKARSDYGTAAAATAGDFPIKNTLHGLPAFNGKGVKTRYPDGEDAGPGPTVAWLKTVPLFDDEVASGFQRMCPLADCGNAFGRLAEPGDVTFMNTDLTVLLHRDPVGEWLGTDSVCFWESNGVGMSDARLFDEHGIVGRAIQTLLLR